MYASLSWDTHPGPGELAEVVAEITRCFEDGRDVVWLLTNSVIFKVDNRIDYLEVNEAIESVAKQFEDQVHYAFFCHNARQPYRGIEHTMVDEQLAQIAPHLFFHQNLNERSRELFAREWKRVRAHSLSFTPLVRLRMFNAPSSPVRTPSFMPKFEGQYFWLKRTNEGRDESGELKESLIARSPVRIHALQATLGHHSNGQEGCLFDQQVLVDGECSLSRDPGPLTINRRDGSFSTNYLRLMAYRMNWRHEGLRLKDSSTLGLGLEVHPREFGPGGIEPQLHELYGGTRLLASLERVSRTKNAKRVLELKAAYISGTSELEGDVCDCLVSIEGAWSWDRFGGWGVFGRYIYGQDYYNLAFVDNLSRFQFGIVFDSGRFSQFEIPSL